jgi:hypothetical protein
MNRKPPLPAGIFDGIEAFWYRGEKWVIANGKVELFHESPPVVQQTIVNAFMDDSKSIAYLSKMGLKKFTEAFETWYRCVVGGIDTVADLDTNRFTPDAYNNMCTDFECPHRGKLCSQATGLKNYECETLAALKNGKSMEATASLLYVSLAGMKSRVEKIREKLNAPNMASLMVKTVELGI